ncbi:MAG: filamentous hemagglutinin N-terminal domain-containing protein [Alphaproteobacteria bacterium]|nr:filamentous hemagglutinin N-terminal domain-containing protein [Alphaproteobacteria bacterium]
MKSVTKAKKNVLKLGVSLAVMTLAAGSAMANPQDPTVQAGNVSFQTNGNTLNINQTSDKAIIDWRSFNIDAGETTNFIQPNSSSFTLNRVNDANPSRINGTLTANGNIAIINQNGVYFGGGSRVDVGSLVVSTADIKNDDFMAGNYKFNIAGSANGKIINDGMITARQAGLVGMVAPNVENNGVIEARMGKVQLASGDTFALDFAGDGLINVAVSDDHPARQLATKNTGRLNADGGLVEMTAAAARDTVDNLVINTGVVEARSVGMVDGKIVLNARGRTRTTRRGLSTALNHGTLDASGGDPGEKGGTVEIYGDHVGMMAGSSIDVSGDVGGGKALIGGDFQGTGTQAASRTYFDGTAIVNANALTNGDGGRVIVWADDTNRYYGTIMAEGGALSGDGGFVEVSGKNWLDFDGDVSVLADHGQTGSLLLDPTDIVISNAADGSVTGGSPFEPTAADATSNLNITTLVNALASANITVQTLAAGSQQGNITISDALSWNTDHSLTLSAHNKVIINAAVTARNALNISAADVDIAADISAQAGGASLTMTPNANNIAVGLAGGAGAFSLGTGDLNHILNGWDSITIGNSASTQLLTANAYTWSDDLTLKSGTGKITIAGDQTMGANDLTLLIDNDLTLNADLIGTGTLSIATVSDNIVLRLGGIALANAIHLSTGELDNINDGWGHIIFGNTTNDTGLTISSAYTWRDNVTFQNDANAISVSQAQNFGANNVTFRSNGNMAINQNLTGTGTLRFETQSASGDMSLAGAGAATYALTSTELDRIVNGWDEIIFGRSDGTGAINVGAYANWRDDVRFLKDENNTTNAIAVSGDQTVAAGSDADIIFDGNTSLGNTITTQNGDIGFNHALTLTGNTVTHSGTGATSFGGTVNGAHNLTMNGTGTHSFTGAVGGTTRLADVTLANPASMTSAGAFRVANYTQTTGAASAFNSAGLDATGNVTITGTTVGGTITAGGDITLDGTNINATLDAGDDVSITASGTVAGTIDAGDDLTITGTTISGTHTAGDVMTITGTGITGTLTGATGALDSGAGTIVATTSFGALDIDGAGATLSAGYIGAAGTATQTMANLITIGGVTKTPATANSNYKFAGFIIGAEAITSSGNSNNNTSNLDIPRLVQPTYLFTPTAFTTPTVSDSDYEVAAATGSSTSWKVIIDNPLLAMQPDLYQSLFDGYDVSLKD